VDYFSQNWIACQQFIFLTAEGDLKKKKNLIKFLFNWPMDFARMQSSRQWLELLHLICSTSFAVPTFGRKY
jgi:hypothetical protein